MKLLEIMMRCKTRCEKLTGRTRSLGQIMTVYAVNAADGTLSAKAGVVYDFENDAANEMEVTVTATDAGLTLDANPVESATFGAAPWCTAVAID